MDDHRIAAEFLLLWGASGVIRGVHISADNLMLYWFSLTLGVVLALLTVAGYGAPPDWPRRLRAAKLLMLWGACGAVLGRYSNADHLMFFWLSLVLGIGLMFRTVAAPNGRAAAWMD